MFSINQYDEFLKVALKKVSGKKYEGKYNDIVNNIKEFEKKANEYNEKKISYNTIMYEVKYLKNVYNEELKEAITNYQNIIFPDLVSKNDVGSIINSPFNLKVWFLRYLCIKIINTDLINIIKSELTSNTITNKYNELDTILFKSALKSKVLI